MWFLLYDFASLGIWSSISLRLTFANIAITDFLLFSFATQICWITGIALFDQPRIKVWSTSIIGVLPLRRFSTRSRSFDVTKAMINAAIVTEAIHIKMAMALFTNVPVGIFPSNRTELLVPHIISKNASWKVFSPLSRKALTIEIKKEKISHQREILGVEGSVLTIENLNLNHFSLKKILKIKKWNQSLRKKKSCLKVNQERELLLMRVMMNKWFKKVRKMRKMNSTYMNKTKSFS